MLVLRDSLLMVREAAKKSGLIGKELSSQSGLCPLTITDKGNDPNP